MTRSPISADDSRELIRAGTRALAVRSAALVRRGLRDLARDTNWLLRKVFEGPAAHASISPDGQLALLTPQVRHGSQSLTLFDLERSLPTLALSLDSQPFELNAPARFAWSPDSRYLVGAWGEKPGSIELFDLQSKLRLGSFGKFSGAPVDVLWSPAGTLVASSSGGRNPLLEVWKMQPESAATGGAAAALLKQLRAPDWINLAAETDSEETSGFSGYGRLAFSPDEKTLACVAKMGGEWADDLIAFLSTRTLIKRAVFEAQGSVTDLTWSNDGNRLVFCSAGQAYGIDPASAERTQLPFGGERCVWHPHLPICLFFSSWLRSSAKGRLFLVDMNRIRIFDELAAEGVLDLRWSADGTRAYAITNEGLAYIYEPELL